MSLQLTAILAVFRTLAQELSYPLWIIPNKYNQKFKII